MIGYFDTSSVVPMLIRESNAIRCQTIWADMAQVVTSRLTYIEAQAAVAAAERAQRITSTEARSAHLKLDSLWTEMFVMEIDTELMYAAAACAREFGLRGFDAAHCASAMTIGGIDVLAVSGDQRLLNAWLQAGMTIADTASA